jgi:hypothetical protein
LPSARLIIDIVDKGRFEEPGGKRCRMPEAELDTRLAYPYLSEEAICQDRIRTK